MLDAPMRASTYARNSADRVVDWLRRHDPGYSALRRAARAAILMPALFAFGDRVIGNPTLSYFLAFGSFAMLLLVDFPGTLVERIQAQASLGLACAVLIALGTLASQSQPVAVISMVLVAFVVLFAGVVSSVFASASTSLLLAFILPVSLPGPVSQIPDRVAGWGLAAAVSVVAVTVLWPAEVCNPIRGLAIEACRALAARLRAGVAFVRSDGGPDAHAAFAAAVAGAEASVAAMGNVFYATPYRPGGLTVDARAVIRLVDELRWLETIVLRAAPAPRPGQADESVCEVKLAAAQVLERAAARLDHPRADPEPLAAARAALRQALAALERSTTAALPTAGMDPSAAAAEIVSGLDPSFRAQELSFVADQVATNIEFAAAAQARGWLDRLVGREPAGFTGQLNSIRRRMMAHAQLSSSWLHNSLRGAIGLGLAVLIADLTSVEHGFWVVFGALAVLRSNALSTGQNVVRALVGTTAGFIVGGTLVYLIGTNQAVLWILLPIVVLFAGLAPAVISFAAGQAAFTVTLLVLFNLLVPVGWKIGLLRIEDVAIGCGASLLVGLLFWPRGAAAGLGRALSQAYLDSARYLADAVQYGVGRCDAAGPMVPAPQGQAARAGAAVSRLDDTFRNYLVERGAKPMPLAEVTSLVTGVVGVRLAADAVMELWDGGAAAGGDRSAARQELLGAATRLVGWYDRFAASLTGMTVVPDPLAPDQVADGRLVDAVAHDLQGRDGRATATGVRVIWTGDHLDAVRRLQEVLVEPARAAVAMRA
jgi:uncharacterized membrane protein YccC